MSVLAPFFFMGALAIGLPILFHLIRRRPKGEVEFSSLMFLEPTPPRLTRRSRLENWPLLLMRALALALLAAAFMRPFFRNATFLQDDKSGRRLMMLVDTSASMQRAGLWDQAKEKAAAIIDDLDEGDQLAIVGFDDKPTTLLGYEQSSELTLAQLKTAARSALDGVAPTWRATNLGAAISYAADMAVTYAPKDDTENQSDDKASSPTGPAHMFLVSDMQEGSDRESLQVFAWPKELKLDVRRVIPEKQTNASAQILSKDASGDGERVRVRISNSANATASRFRLSWSGAGGQQSELPVQVPPGESRVVKLPMPNPDVTALRLQGDDFSFDNQRYLVSPKAQSLTLLYVGTAKASNVDEVRQSLLFYLQRVPWNNTRREVTITPIQPAKLVTPPDPKTTPLVVVAKALSTDQSNVLKQYASMGGKILLVMSDDSSAAMNGAINDITGANVKVTEGKVKDYVMFSKIDFRHPLFASMSDPQFNDFTKVKFWTYRKLDALADDWQVAARFDNGDPAIVQVDLGDGKLWVMTAGWQPSSSQLALSTKFLPLMYSFFNTLGGQFDPFGSVAVGQPIGFAPSDDAKLTGPDGMELEYQSSDDVDQISQPGIYTYSQDDTPQSFAVNLAASESDTTPMDVDSLERFGISLGEAKTTTQMKVAERQLRDIELEKQQKVWQWLLVAALAFLGIETLWGGLLSRAPRTAAAA